MTPRIRRFFAIETGQISNTFHAFLSVAARDAFVAINPYRREPIASSSPLARRMLRAYDLWELVGPEDTNNTHRVIPYLDR